MTGMPGSVFAREATLTECLDGAYPPAYRNEDCLSGMRGLAQWFSSMNATGSGIVETLSNYVLGPGFSYSVGTKKGMDADPRLIARVQAWLDEFRDENNFDGCLDDEMFREIVNSGEVFAHLTPGKRGVTKINLVPPIAIRDCGSWDEVQGRYPRASNFTFGIHTPDYEPQTVYGYSRQWPDGTWDYIPAARMEHYKSNVPTHRAKRGVSDFLPAAQWLTSHERLAKNTASGASELAAIAYILQFETASQSAVYSMRNSMADYTYTSPGGRTEHVTVRRPGSVLNVPKGQSYMSGPAGAERGISFIEIAASVLRIIGQRFCMPEGFVSGNDANANYASSLSAGGRFHRYAVTRQKKLSSYFQRIFWTALKDAFFAGRFSGYGYIPWQKFQDLITINIEAPSVDELSKLDTERLYQMRHQAGIMSTETYRSKVGLDNAQEEERLGRQTPNEFRQPYMS